MALALFCCLWIWCIWCVANSFILPTALTEWTISRFSNGGSSTVAALYCWSGQGWYRLEGGWLAFPPLFPSLFPSLCVLFFLIFFIFLSKTIVEPLHDHVYFAGLTGDNIVSKIYSAFRTFRQWKNQTCKLAITVSNVIEFSCWEVSDSVGSYNSHWRKRRGLLKEDLNRGLIHHLFLFFRSFSLNAKLRCCSNLFSLQFSFSIDMWTCLSLSLLISPPLILTLILHLCSIYFCLFCNIIILLFMLFPAKRQELILIFLLNPPLNEFYAL